MTPFELRNYIEGKQAVADFRLAVGSLPDSSRQRQMSADVIELQAKWETMHKESD